MKKWVWNFEKTKVVEVSKLRNFSIAREGGEFKVIAWFSDKETLQIGQFLSLDEAQRFLLNLLD